MCHYSWNGKTINNTNPLCVILTLFVQKVMHICLIIIIYIEEKYGTGRCLYNIFPQFHIKNKSEKIILLEIYFFIFSKNVVWTLHISYNKCKYVFIHILMELSFSRQDFERYGNINVHENAFIDILSSGRVGGRTDMTKLIDIFRNFMKKLKNQTEILYTWSK